MPLHRAVEVLVANPFAQEECELEAAERAMDDADVVAALAGHEARGEDVAATRLLLALGHVQARRTGGDPRHVLDERTVPARALRGLPRARGDYRRIAAAAGRCHARLLAIAGRSRIVRGARAETWAACFGRSLHHTLALERVVVDHDVLLLGDTGTGKELFARAVLDGTPGGADGRPAPQATVNAAAMPEGMIESELFGHERGAFTGAAAARRGRIRTARGGAFFLDEVGDLPLATQVKLLRVMEDNVVTPVGADAGEVVDLRWVAATHRDLPAMVERGEFRRDLYQRLAGHVIRIPPLGERLEDVPVIAEAFVRGYVGVEELEDVRDAIDRFLERAMTRGYPWPGNVRELQNVLRSLLLGVEPHLAGRDGALVAARDGVEALPARVAAAEAPLSEVETWYVERVLDRVGGNVSQAARALEVDRATVRRKLASRGA